MSRDWPLNPTNPGHVPANNTTHRRTMGKSSKDKRDAYYRQAKESGYRARSAYKLLQLDEAFNLLSFAHDDARPPCAPDSDSDSQQRPEGRPRRVIDLCAAPGSWSQVLARRLPPGSTIVAVDLQPMTPIPGVVTLQADITHPSTLALLQSQLGGRAGEAGGGGEYADLVVCDGAPDVTGLHDLDEYVQASLLLSALNLAACVLRPGANGTFVAKIFRGRDADLLFAQLRTLFGRVTCAKPRASRASSIEAFVVCQDYRPPPGFEPSLERPLSLDSSGWGEGEGGGGAGLVSFVACGDLSAFDADATFRLPAVGPDGQRRQSVEPVQPPTMPPYRRAVEMRRQLGGGGGGSGGGGGGGDGGGGDGGGGGGGDGGGGGGGGAMGEGAGVRE